ATLVAIGAFTVFAAEPGKPVALCDGKTFKGWDGDTEKTWRIQDGAFVGGSLTTTVPRNEFLATTRSFTNFVLRLKFKLAGTEGFINGGGQIRSEGTKEPPNEMSGCQAELGEPEWGACQAGECVRHTDV